MMIRKPSRFRCPWHVPILGAGLLLLAAAGLAAEGAVGGASSPNASLPTPAPPVPSGCINDGGPFYTPGDWANGSGTGFAIVKALPGTVCSLNVGNISPWAPGFKIDSCVHLKGRAAEVANSDCDTITVIELLSDFQCDDLCIRDPNGEACRVCAGCGQEGAEDFAFSCEKQAAVVCPPDRYEISCTQAPASSVGCDCLCRKKDVCAAQGPQCEEIPNIRVDDYSWLDQKGVLHSCDLGNYATCIRCTDPYGGPSTGYCAVHPSHCSNILNPVDRGECLKACSSGLVQRAAAAIEGMDIRTMSGDFNCTPKGSPCQNYIPTTPVPITIIDECPWLDATNSYDDMTVCRQTGHSASVGFEGNGGGFPFLGDGTPNCTLDFVMSTHCGCGETRVVTNREDYGDHRTIIFGQTNQPVLELIPGTSHRILHGNATVVGLSGNTLQFPFANEEHEGYLGYSCGASVFCGFIADIGTMTASRQVCESRHQARVRQPSGCFAPGKAMLCEQARASTLAVGSGYAHGAATADSAGANATASGDAWRVGCERKRRIVDLHAVTAMEIVSDPLTFLANAEASCTAPPPASTGNPNSGTASGGEASEPAP